MDVYQTTFYRILCKLHLFIILCASMRMNIEEFSRVDIMVIFTFIRGTSNEARMKLPDDKKL